MKTYKELKEIEGYAPTGCLLLDLVVGGGEGLGFPYGRMVNIIGDSSSGKTFLAWETLAANFYKYKDKLKWNYDDSETGNTFNTKELYGVDLLNHERHFGVSSDLVEEMDGNTSLFLDEIKSVNQKGIYVVDSLDGLSDSDKEAQEKQFKTMATTGKAKDGSGSYNTGTASHLSKQYFRTKAGKLDKKNVLLLIISQVRENLNAGLFGKKHYRAGGKAMDFYAHTCLWLYNVKKIKRADRVVGVLVRAKAEKSKTPRPYRECTFSIYFDYGVDDIGTSIDYLFDLRGKDGELLKASHDIAWGGDGKEKNWQSLRDWLKSINKYDELKEANKGETGKNALNKAWVEDYIESNQELKEQAEAYFGKGIDRATLISMIENDPKLKEELNTRVVEKWEGAENAIKSDRKRKY